MDWTVYWFMLPVCVVVASVAMFSGISGAALLAPVFLIGFPLLDVPRLSTAAAIGTSLFLETFGFGVGVARYASMRLVDVRTARSIVVVTVPLGAAGAMAARHVPAPWLRIGYGVVMAVLAVVLAHREPGRVAAVQGAAPALVSASDRSHPPCGAGQARRVVSAAGRHFDYCAHGLGLQRLLSGVGAFVAGLISTGVGEATLPGLVRRSRFPVEVAAATSTVIVAGTVTGAAGTHLVQLASEGGLGAIPWNLLVWAVPGGRWNARTPHPLRGALRRDVTGPTPHEDARSSPCAWYMMALTFAALLPSPLGAGQTPGVCVSSAPSVPCRSSPSANSRSRSTASASGSARRESALLISR